MPPAKRGAAGVVGAWDGTWLSGTNYKLHELVYYEGSSYIAIKEGSNKKPNTETSYWALVAKEGAAGSNGTKGETGPTGPEGPARTVVEYASGTNSDTAKYPTGYVATGGGGRGAANQDNVSGPANSEHTTPITSSEFKTAPTGWCFEDPEGTVTAYTVCAK